MNVRKPLFLVTNRWPFNKNITVNLDTFIGKNKTEKLCASSITIFLFHYMGNTFTDLFIQTKTSQSNVTEIYEFLKVDDI